MIVAESGDAGAVIAVVITLIVMLWVAPVVLAGALSNGKSRGWGVGIILGLVLGWLGVLIVLILSNQTYAKQSAYYQQQQYLRDNYVWDAEIGQWAWPDTVASDSVTKTGRTSASEV